jgi:hypothetical protein
MGVIKLTNKLFGNQNITINFAWPKPNLYLEPGQRRPLLFSPSLTIFLMCHIRNVESARALSFKESEPHWSTNQSASPSKEKNQPHNMRYQLEN